MSSEYLPGKRKRKVEEESERRRREEREREEEERRVQVLSILIFLSSFGKYFPRRCWRP